MKTWTKIFSTTLCLLLLFAFSCEKDTTAPQQELSQKAQAYHAILMDAEAQTGVQLGLTASDLQAELAAQGETSANNRAPICYDYCDLEAFLDCFGSSSPECLIWDLNGDGTVTVADLLFILAGFGCPPPAVTADILTFDSPQLAIYTAINGLVKNSSLIDGVIWWSAGGVCNFQEAKWYFDGVLVSTNIPSMQLQYPGASPSDYDAAIDCNKGWHEIQLDVRVGSTWYSTSTCIQIKLNEPIPNCSSNYCL